ncbi:hypothetical protein [Streptosporangium roseum]|uniref:hypothetical protein n=1 Tax=Streptosporangium roseum TaxID=2001 RepID=UPI00332655FF
MEELVRVQCELPGCTTLDELTKKIRTEVIGNWILNLTPPAAAPTTQLDLESRVLFAP